MAHHVLGDRIDIHTGGEDLRFPHHDNELAQVGSKAVVPSAGCQQQPSRSLLAAQESEKALLPAPGVAGCAGLRPHLRAMLAAACRQVYMSQ